MANSGIQQVQEDIDQLLEFYKVMKKIRLFEEKIDWLFSRGRLGGTTHLSIGQEAVAVGIISHLRKDDYVLSSHRGHGHMIAKGGHLFKIFAELMGKIDGYCYGKGGTQHLCARDEGFYGTNGITGGGIPIATGIALSSKLRGSDQIVVSFFGDGAINQGTFHESLNMASLWSLPILYVCENNLYGMSTHIKDVICNEDLGHRLDGYKIKNTSVDGMDVRVVYKAAQKAIEYIRTQQKPFFIEAKTYRFCGHSKSDARKYRTKEEEKFWEDKDCLETFRKYLCQYHSAEAMVKIDEEIVNEIEEALRLSEQSLETPMEYAAQGVYKNE